MRCLVEVDNGHSNAEDEREGRDGASSIAGVRSIILVVLIIIITSGSRAGRGRSAGRGRASGGGRISLGRLSLGGGGGGRAGGRSGGGGGETLALGVESELGRKVVVARLVDADLNGVVLTGGEGLLGGPGEGARVLDLSCR